MRTSDFSAAPRLAQAGAMFTGATRYTGLRSWVTLSWTWRKLVRRMRQMDGYCWHKVYWERPFTLGTLAYFETREDLLTIARSPEHRALMRWITDGTRNATGGYIRLYSVEEQGYTNGVWRAEAEVMRHIEHFTPLPGESAAKPVDDAGSEIR